MTQEGVGETSGLADALSFFKAEFFEVGCSCALENFCDALVRCGLETFVACAPEFRPRRSFFDFAGGLCLLPFDSALLLPLARRELPGARLLLGFRGFVGRGRLLLRGGGRYESRHRRRDHSDGERGSKHDFVHEFTSLYFHGAAPAGRQSASVRNLKSR